MKGPRASVLAESSRVRGERIAHRARRITTLAAERMVRCVTRPARAGSAAYARAAAKGGSAPCPRHPPRTLQRACILRCAASRGARRRSSPGSSPRRSRSPHPIRRRPCPGLTAAIGELLTTYDQYFEAELERARREDREGAAPARDAEGLVMNRILYSRPETDGMDPFGRRLGRAVSMAEEFYRARLGRAESPQHARRPGPAPCESVRGGTAESHRRPSASVLREAHSVAALRVPYRAPSRAYDVQTNAPPIASGGNGDSHDPAVSSSRR